MHFSLPRVFVVPVGNTLPTTGTTATLSPNQFGVFLPSYAPATAVNIEDAETFFLAQGRPNDDYNLKSLKSDFIASKNIISKYIKIGSATATEQITKLSNFNVQCDDETSIVLRVLSKETNVSYHYGMTVPITVKAPCCDCDADPCAQLTCEQLLVFLQEYADKINENSQLQGYVTAAVEGDCEDPEDIELVLTGAILTPDEKSCVVGLNPFYYDNLEFFTYAQKGAPTTQDYAIPDPCNTLADVEVVQRASSPKGTSNEVEQVWIDNFSYHVPAFKTLYQNPHYNPLYYSNVVDGTVYDEIVIRFINNDRYLNHGDFVRQESLVRIFTPQASTAGVRAIVEANIGALKVI